MRYLIGQLILISFGVLPSIYYIYRSKVDKLMHRSREAIYILESFGEELN
ncbi:hypothetical protein Sjap_019970 [Stephania japonica]|uniref:Uncharacterized protein n=1 Tax=Stephania japonica TaxID=461633 RepID=A0AAP0F182_9MAGN